MSAANPQIVPSASNFKKRQAEAGPNLDYFEREPAYGDRREIPCSTAGECARTGSARLFAGREERASPWEETNVACRAGSPD